MIPIINLLNFSYISSMSPFSFSMTTKMRSGVSSICWNSTTPGCRTFWRISTSVRSAASLFEGNLSLSISFTATCLPLLR